MHSVSTPLLTTVHMCVNTTFDVYSHTIPPNFLCAPRTQLPQISSHFALAQVSSCSRLVCALLLMHMHQSYSHVYQHAMHRCTDVCASAHRSIVAAHAPPIALYPVLAKLFWRFGGASKSRNFVEIWAQSAAGEVSGKFRVSPTGRRRRPVPS